MSLFHKNVVCKAIESEIAQTLPYVVSFKGDVGNSESAEKPVLGFLRAKRTPGVSWKQCDSGGRPVSLVCECRNEPVQEVLPR